MSRRPSSRGHARLVRQNVAVTMQPVSAAAWQDIPATSLVGAQDNRTPAALQRDQAKRAHRTPLGGRWHAGRMGMAEMSVVAEAGGSTCGQDRIRLWLAACWGTAVTEWAAVTGASPTYKPHSAARHTVPS